MLTAKEFAVLRGVRNCEGRLWKSKLSSMWQKSHYPGYTPDEASTLQALRNSSRFGPRGLKNLTLL